MQKRVAVETEKNTLRIDVTLLESSAAAHRRTDGAVLFDDFSLLANGRDGHAAFVSPTRAPPLGLIAATR